jgi:hypothetical protein
LSPAKRPAEPLAEVLSYRPAEAPSSPAAGADRTVAGEVFYGDGRTIRRRFDNAVLAVGGKPLLRASSGQAIRRVDRDYVIEQPDGSQVIYHGAAGYEQAIR